MRSSLVKLMASTSHQYVVDFTRKWGNLHVRFNSSLSLGSLHLRSWKSERRICHSLPLVSATRRISPRCGLIFADVCVPSYNRHSGQSEPSRYSALWLFMHDFSLAHAHKPSAALHGHQRTVPNQSPARRVGHVIGAHGWRMALGCSHIWSLSLSLPAPCCLPQAEYPSHKPLDISACSSWRLHMFFSYPVSRRSCS